MFLGIRRRFFHFVPLALVLLSSSIHAEEDVCKGFSKVGRKSTIIWTPELITTIVRDMYASGLKPSMELFRAEDPAIVAIIQKHAGKDKNAEKFYQGLKKRFGGWEKAKKRIGVSTAEASESARRRQRFWHDELLIAIVKDMYASGLKPTAAKLRAEDPLMLAIVERHAGKGKTATAFNEAINESGGWKKLRARVGISAEQALIPKYNFFWSTDIVTKILKDCYLADLQPTALKFRNEDPALLEIVQKHAGSDKSATAFYSVLVRRHDGLENASRVLAMGEVYQRQNKFWVREKILDVIIDLEKEGLPYRTLRKFKFKDRAKARAILHRHFGIDKSWQLFGMAVKRSYGSWDKAVIAAGFHKNEFWTRELVKNIIEEIDRAGLPLNTAFIESEDPRVVAIIRRLSGKEAGAVNFYQGAYRRYQGWHNALEAVGLSPADIYLKQVHTRGARTDEDVFFTLSELERAGRLGSEKSLHADESAETMQIIADNTGVHVSGKQFYHYVIVRYGSWQNALSAAGLDIKKYVLKPRVGDEKLIEALKFIEEKGFSIHSSDLKFNRDPAVDLVLQDFLGVTITGAGLHGRLRRAFGNYALALEAAGFNSLNYTRVNMAKLNMPLHSTTGEWEDNADGTRSYRNYLGPRAPTPLEEIAARELQENSDLEATAARHQQLHSTISNLSPRERHLAQRLLVYMNGEDSIDDRPALRQFFHSYGEPAPDPQDISRVLQELRAALSN